MSIPSEILSRLTDRQRRTLVVLGDGELLPWTHFKDNFSKFSGYLDDMEVVADGRELELDNRVNFNKPLYPFGAVVAVTGVKAATLRNWLTRKQLVLNANEDHDEEKWRLFSVRDTVQIAVLNSLSSLGLSIKDASTVADVLMPLIENMAVRIGGFAGDPVLHFWKQDGVWKYVAAFDTSKGVLSTEGLPPAALTLRPYAILTEVYLQLRPNGIR